MMLVAGYKLCNRQRVQVLRKMRKVSKSNFEFIVTPLDR
jgi:hypothetical protein